MSPNQVAAEHALEWCRKHPGWLRICDVSSADYDSRYYRHGYVILGGRFIPMRKAHTREYDWAWSAGIMMVVRPLRATTTSDNAVLSDEQAERVSL